MKDRVGDFIATGGGPMADFFEKIAPQVGVTIEQFAKLSGPEALQLYVDSLEKANVTSAEFTFYMEAMASDATALIPLLQDGGSAMQALGDQAERAGRILSNETLRGAEQLRSKMNDLEGEIRTELTTAMIGLEDELVVLSEFVRDYGIPALEGLIRFAASAAEQIGNAAEAIALVRGEAKATADSVANSIGSTYGIDTDEGPFVGDPLAGAFDGPENTAKEKALNDLYGFDGSTPGQVDNADNLIPPVGIPTAEPGLNNRNPATLGFDDDTTSGKGGGGGRGPTRDDLESMASALASERELLELDYQEKLEALETFRAEKLGTEEEYNELEARIHQDHADKIAEIDRAQMALRLSGFRGMFGDLSSLMQSESKKLFEIGKAASLAEASVSGYEAATEAWSKGMKIGGPPVAAAFAGASLLRTGVYMSQIASTNIGGASAGGAAGGGGSVGSPEASSAIAQQQVNQNIGDAEFFPRSAVVALAEKLQELSREGAIVTVS
ncbi:MAG: hypothetical protein AAF982_01970 [Pseudomonadota bacterium]